MQPTDAEVNEMTTRDLVLIDRSTGEEISLVQDDDTEIALPLSQKEELPRYLQELMRQVQSGRMDMREAPEILSIFEGGTQRPFSAYLNKEVLVLGMIVWYHPPYMSREVRGPGNVLIAASTMQPGYEQARILIDEYDENGVPVIVVASMGTLANHINAITHPSMNGMYLWDVPVRYRFMQDGTGKPYRMINMDRVKSLREKLHPVKEKAK